MINIQVVGSGCPNCSKLEQLCRDVITESNISASIEKVTDINQFGELGIMITPGLVINNTVLSQGKIPTKSTLKHWFSNFT